MATYVQKEVMPCYVTFISIVEADNEQDAQSKFNYGLGELVKEVIGDSIDFLDHTDIVIEQSNEFDIYKKEG